MRALLSMQDVADVAHVRRPVVSTWRSRYVDGPVPFPSPVAADDSRFDADEVAQWLRETGRGNNPEAPDDIPLHTDLVRDAAESLDTASLLLFLAARAGGRAADLDEENAFDIAIGVGEDSLVPLDAVSGAIADMKVVELVDRLAEAAYGPVRVLDRLVDLGCAADAAATAELLTAEGDLIVNAVAAELVRHSRGLVVPTGPGGLSLTRGAFAILDEYEIRDFGCPAPTCERPWQRALWRMMLAGGAGVRQADITGPEMREATVLAQWASAADSDAVAFFDWIDDFTVSLGPGGAAMVIGPAALLVDDLTGEAESRRAQLLGDEGYFAPLRFVARLPKGLTRVAGRRQLAIWVLAPSVDESRAVTVLADHSAHSGDTAEIQALAADVAACAAGDRARDVHSFLRGTVRASRVVVPQHRLRTAAERPLPEEGTGGEELARIWEAAGRVSSVDLLQGFAFAAGSADRSTSGAVSWSAATVGHGRAARLIPGARIPEDSIGPAGPGRVAVIGREELRGYIAIGDRAVDRLELESVAPRSRFTEPGDVVYLPTSPPVAQVDRDGGHLVIAPARVARCRSDVDLDGRRLLPHVVAADIAAQRSANTDAWVLRTVPVEQMEPAEILQRRIDERRDAIRAEFAALKELEHAVARGLSADVLTAQFTRGATGPAHTKENA
ncbi:MAG: DNA-binding protein [Gordonia sp. (in: high G+C Gram-positive bacteria)]